MANFKEMLADVEAVVLDVDGVFTDGGIMPLPDGDFLRKYYAKDGYAVAYALRQGLRIYIITGGRGATLERRFKYLNVTELHLNCSDKASTLKDLLERNSLDADKVIFMGDDIPDVQCMNIVGIPVCPADAAAEAIEASLYVSEYCGGQGCVRDILEQVLRAKKLWALDYHGYNTVSA